MTTVFLEDAWRATAEKVIPDGSCTLSKRPKAFPDGSPRYALVGRGPTLISTDGREYLDLICALGALTVGHAHPKVVEAVTRQMGIGAIFSLPSILEAAVAERLCDVIPCAEQLKFVKTGSEACSAAVRIARMATGRDVILKCEGSYHGWHDGFAAAKDPHPGVPSDLTWLMKPFLYNDLDSLDAAFVDCQNEQDLPAAVILEPVQGEEPKDGFLHELVLRAHAHGALVIFDEMLAGGRLAVGGAQAFYGVTPDLATFGKAFGGGLPLAFVCGPRALMQHAWPVSGTFSGDALALAACDAMLDLYRDEDVIGQLWLNGSALFGAIASCGVTHPALGLQLHGHHPRFWVSFGPAIDRRVAMSIVVQQCAARGVLIHQAVVFSNAALTPKHVFDSADILFEAFRLANDYVTTGVSRLAGAPYEDSVR